MLDLQSLKPLIAKAESNRVSNRRRASSPPLAPAASLVRPRSCRALSACLPRAFRRLRALVLRSLSPCASPHVAPLTPSRTSHAPLSRRPLPARVPAAPVRAPAATASFCALACRRVFCAVLLRRVSHRPPTSPRALHAPRAGPVLDFAFVAGTFCCHGFFRALCAAGTLLCPRR